MSDDLERRLRESLGAYADLVDARDDDALPARPTREPVVRRWRGGILAVAAAAAVVTGTLVVIDAHDPGVDSTAGSALSATDDTGPEAPESTSAGASDQALAVPDAASAQGFLSASVEPGTPYVVDLSTHCGVRGLDIGGVWFAADPPLVEEGGHPPDGWGDPSQPGTVTMLSATEAVFADDLGHEVRLRADESARPPLCE